MSGENIMKPLVKRRLRLRRSNESDVGQVAAYTYYRYSRGHSARTRLTEYDGDNNNDDDDDNDNDDAKNVVVVVEQQVVVSSLLALLPDELWRRVLTFLTMDDYWFKTRVIHHRLRQITHDMLLCSTELHFSFLQQQQHRMNQKPELAANSNDALQQQQQQQQQPLICIESIFSNNDDFWGGRRRRRRIFANLTYLDFGGLLYFTGEKRNGKSIFTDIFGSARNLLTLDCSGCIRLKGSALEEAAAAVVCNDDAVGDDDVDVVRPQQQQQQQQQLKLRHLYLTGCRRVTTETLKLLLPRCPRLESLLICGTSQTIKGHFLTDIPSCPPPPQLIRSLDLSAMDSEVILNGYADEVEALSVGSSRSFTSLYGALEQAVLRQLQPLVEHEELNNNNNKLDAITSIRQRVYSEMPWFPQRAFSKLRYINFNNLIHDLRPGTLSFIALQSHQMVEVHLSGVNQLQDIEVQLLALSCGHSLKMVNLQCCSKLTDTAFEWVGRYCPALVDLNVSACFDLTDRSIVAVATGCAKLRTLRMAHLKRVTDHALEVIARHLKHLLLLNVQSCSQLQQCPESLPDGLLEIDKRDTGITSLPPLPALVIKDGRRAKQQQKQPNTFLCSATWQSQSFGRHFIKPAPMWCCRDCELVPNRGDRGLCGTCASNCHRDHDIYLSGMRLFFCDCAFGFGACDCQMLK